MQHRREKWYFLPQPLKQNWEPTISSPFVLLINLAFHGFRRALVPRIEFHLIMSPFRIYMN